MTFEKAVEAALKARKDRRTRTVYDFLYFTRRFMRRCPGLARQKARLILSGVFSTAVKRGWCSENPVARVEAPRVVEKQVPILSPQEIKDLRQTTELYQGGSCAAAVGMMLYAGIRPHEVARLTWAQVDLRERAIYILPQHSKTGGARRVTIHKPLMKILRVHRRADGERICPAGWLRHWRELRRAAGWDSPAHPWPQDALRHTFASYHLSHFRSYAELQVEIGGSTILDLRFTKCWDSARPEGAGKFISQARSGCFHFSPFTRARSASFHDGDGGFVSQLPLCGQALLYRERYPAAPDDIHAAGVDDIQPLCG